MKIKKLSEITRTEAFFTGSLFHASNMKKGAIEALLISKLELDEASEITDSGYEVCFFRDFAKEGYISRQNASFEKQTFDNVFILSDEALVLIEAKAHQGFDPKQIDHMVKAANLIMDSKLPFKKVYLVGICSSKYSPKPRTVKQLDAVITWSEIAKCFGDDAGIFVRADEIYNN